MASFLNSKGIIHIISFWYEVSMLLNEKILISMAAIIKLNIDSHAAICINMNIDFQIPYALSFPKMCYFSNLHKFWAKF